jgi:hypothetical protein
MERRERSLVLESSSEKVMIGKPGSPLIEYLLTMVL